MVKKILVGLGILVVALFSTYIFYDTFKSQAQEEDTGIMLGKRRGRYSITVRVRDDDGVRVVSAVLDDRSIRVSRHPTIFGIKGSTTVRVSSGDHVLRWTVTKPAVRGSRITLSFNRTIHVRNRNVLVVIHGQNAYVY